MQVLFKMEHTWWPAHKVSRGDVVDIMRFRRVKISKSNFYRVDHSIQLMQRTGTPFPVVLFHINDQPWSSKTWYSNSFSKANQTSLTKASWYNHSTAYAPLKFWLSMPIWSLHQNENLVRLRPDAWYGTITFCPEPKGRKNSNSNTTQIILKMRKYWEPEPVLVLVAPRLFSRLVVFTSTTTFSF